MEINTEQKWQVKGDPFIEIPTEHKAELYKKGRDIINNGLELNMFCGLLSEIIIVDTPIYDSFNDILYTKGNVVEYEGSWLISQLP